MPNFFLLLVSRWIIVVVLSCLGNIHTHTVCCVWFPWSSFPSRTTFCVFRDVLLLWDNQNEWQVLSKLIVNKVCGLWRWGNSTLLSQSLPQIIKGSPHFIFECQLLSSDLSFYGSSQNNRVTSTQKVFAKPTKPVCVPCWLSLSHDRVNNLETCWMSVSPDV